MEWPFQFSFTCFLVSSSKKDRNQSSLAGSFATDSLFSSLFLSEYRTHFDGNSGSHPEERPLADCHSRSVILPRSRVLTMKVRPLDVMFAFKCISSNRSLTALFRSTQLSQLRKLPCLPLSFMFVPHILAYSLEMWTFNMSKEQASGPLLETLPSNINPTRIRRKPRSICSHVSLPPLILLPLESRKFVISILYHLCLLVSRNKRVFIACNGFSRIRIGFSCRFLSRCRPLLPSVHPLSFPPSRHS